MRLIKTLLLTALPLLLLAGCTTKFLYRNIDWIALSYIDDYVNLTTDQERMVGNSVRRFSKWHRATELPKYVAWIDTLKKTDFSATDVKWVTAQSDQLRLFSVSMAEKLGPDLYALNRQLSDKQIDELLDNLHQKHQDYKEKYAGKSDTEIREIYTDRMVKGLERWLGSLTSEQEAMLNAWVQNVMITYQARLSQNVRMHQAYTDLLEHRDDAGYFRTTLDRLINQPESYYTPEMEKLIAHNRPLGRQLVADVLNSLTEKQHKHLIGELEYWRQIAVDLQ